MKPADASSTSLSAAPNWAGEAVEHSAPSTFLDNISLQGLVAPVSETEFREKYWERKPLIVHRGIPEYYGDLFSLEKFDSCLTLCKGYVKTADATAQKKATKYPVGTSSALENVLTDMQSGKTLILDAVHDTDPTLGLLCRMLMQETSMRYQANIYLTPPNGKGFTPHWDNHDVFVMQVMGSKHWKVEKIRRIMPPKEAVIEEEGRELRGELYDFTLQPGDVVYIPRGFVHAAECGSESSLHITLGLHPRTWEDFLVATIKAAVLRDDRLQLSLPLGYLKSDGTEIVKHVLKVFQNTANPAFLANVLDQFRDEILTMAPLDISGQVTSFFRPTQLKLDDKVGPRRGLWYSIHHQAETATLKVGSRSITFPDFFAKALEFSLSTPAFSIRALPGDLDDDERIVFIERLMQEALLVRK